MDGFLINKNGVFFYLFFYMFKLLKVGGFGIGFYFGVIGWSGGVLWVWEGRCCGGGCRVD